MELGFGTFYSNDIDELTRKDVYEKIICAIMNSSKLVFPNNYSRIEVQNNNESDYIDINTGELYDSKLVISTNEGESLSKIKRNISYYFKSQVESINEVNESIEKDANVLNTKLFRRISHYVDELNESENLILFFPFPISLDMEYSIIDNLFNDFLDIINNNLKEKLGSKKMYAIYPSLLNKIVIRELDKHQLEYLKIEGLEKYIKILVAS